MNVIFTALSQDVRDEKDGSVTVKPSLSGKLADEAQGFVDMVLYMFTEPNPEKGADGKATTPIRTVYFQPMGKYSAKARVPENIRANVPVSMQWPTVTKILDVLGIEKEVVAEEKPAPAKATKAPAPPVATAPEVVSLISEAN